MSSVHLLRSSLLPDIFARHSVELSRSTLCGWMARSADLLRPLYELVVERVVQSNVIHTDDTPVSVLDLSLPRTRTGRLWVYAGDDRHLYSVDDFTGSSRESDGRRGRSGFRGFGGLSPDQVGQGRNGVQALYAILKIPSDGETQLPAGRLQA